MELETREDGLLCCGDWWPSSLIYNIRFEPNRRLSLSSPTKLIGMSSEAPFTPGVWSGELPVVKF